MKIKPALKYYLTEFQGAINGFYMVVAIILVTVTILSLFVPAIKSGNQGGMELATLVFLFVIGLNSFKGEFIFFIQNGVSRREAVLSFIKSCVIVCEMAAIDIVISLILPLIGIAQYHSLFYILFSSTFTSFGIGYYLCHFIFLVVIYALITMIGYFISLLYYKMNAKAKIIFSICGFLAINLLANLCSFVSNDLAIRILRFIAGIPVDANSLVSSAIYIVYFAILGLIAYQMIKTAKIKQ